MGQTLVSFPLRIQDIEEEDVPDKHGPPDLSNLGKFYILRKRIDAPMVARRNIALAKLVEKQGSAYIDVLNLRGSRGPQRCRIDLMVFACIIQLILW